MQMLLIESAVRATMIAAVVALVLYVMRIKTASARHAVWAGVVVSMTLLPAWVAWGPKAPLPVLPPSVGQTAIAMPVVNLPVAAPIVMQYVSAEPQPTVRRWPTFLLGVYLVGLFALLTRLVIGTIRANRLTRDSCVVPVTIGLLHPRILLPKCSREWPPAQLDAVLTHEGEHARRRDPLFQWLALLNRALFWFHPLAWWLERKLSGLAEEACDAAVLSHGCDPGDYSEYLLELARSVQRTGTRLSVVGMAMPGIGLKHRIGQMLSGIPVPRISRPRMACTVAVCAGAAAILAAGTLVKAQSKAAAGPRFEVASVRPSAPGGGGGRGGADGKSKGGGGGLFPLLEHRRFNFSSTLVGLVVKAYDLNGCGFLGDKDNCALLSGVPSWAKTEQFDIQAKLPDDAPDYNMMQFFDGSATQLKLMLQALLADRFNLKIHREPKQMSVYELTVVKTGAKLTPTVRATFQSKDGTTSVNRSLGWSIPRLPNGEFNTSNTIMTVRDRSIQELTDALSNMMDRPVLDQTGLKGEYDITLEWERDADVPSELGVPGGAMFGPSMFRAFQNELGLKFESTKAQLEGIVVDHVERPSGN
jgi:bla regulator protein BlaR1